MTGYQGGSNIATDHDDPVQHTATLHVIAMTKYLMLGKATSIKIFTTCSDSYNSGAVFSASKS
ncbi:hypothetical protein PAUR_a2801 [Pseudoalteromonas aurantia 208]|uniref:Uncharacterized protein n=1 Tax=Pseudoalteromonas aurantia 208 TaxID=1314867 RepID=A0ABR9EDH1_9GAMM|nr:hypothetical protein [Pseudoalteromonas aurantia 208]